MSVLRMMVHDVTVVRADTLTDRYENTVLDWDNVTRTVTKGWVAQRERAENLEGRDAQVQGHIVYLPPGTDVTGRDRIEWDDLTFELVGPPNKAWSPMKRAEHHIEATIQLVEG